MSLRARVSRLDDYAGELGQALEKLEIEQARGELNRDEQEDFLVDLRAAVESRDLKPLRKKIFQDLLITGAGTVGMLLRPPEGRLRALCVYGGMALMALGFGLLAWRVILYARRRREDLRWLAQLETAVAAGGTVFDVR